MVLVLLGYSWQADEHCVVPITTVRSTTCSTAMANGGKRWMSYDVGIFVAATIVHFDASP